MRWDGWIWLQMCLGEHANSWVSQEKQKTSLQGSEFLNFEWFSLKIRHGGEKPLAYQTPELELAREKKRMTSLDPAPPSIGESHEIPPK